MAIPQSNFCMTLVLYLILKVLSSITYYSCSTFIRRGLAHPREYTFYHDWARAELRASQFFFPKSFDRLSTR
jgi:hypothetical protein